MSKHSLALLQHHLPHQFKRHLIHDGTVEEEFLDGEPGDHQHAKPSIEDLSLPQKELLLLTLAPKESKWIEVQIRRVEPRCGILLHALPNLHGRSQRDGRYPERWEGHVGQTVVED